MSIYQIFMNKYRILMVGPDPSGMGGISRVVRLWQIGGYMPEFAIEYFPSVAEGTGKYQKLLLTLWRFTLTLAEGCRAVYIHTASFNSFYRKCLFMIPAVLLSRRLIVHIHPSYFSQFIADLRGIKMHIARAVLSRAAAFIVLTPDIKDNLANLFPDKPIHVLHNPVDVKGMGNNRGVVRRPDHLLFLGWYMKRKGVYDLVDAVRILREERHDVSADFFGTKEVEELRGYVSKQGLGDSVRIHGWIGEEEKLKALLGCGMLVLPSHTEGIPNVILEAMATKTPIVSTLVGGLKDVLRDGENAIIAEAGNAVDLSRKILLLLQDRELAGRIAENAYREACEMY
ncbi:MAG: glycosyltransferase family 4 protein, partial [Sulfurimonas sp.]|nr:glycosyltransferase family 4 protein [Sulfurimonas sp.]